VDRWPDFWGEMGIVALVLAAVFLLFFLHDPFHQFIGELYDSLPRWAQSVLLVIAVGASLVRLFSWFGGESSEEGDSLKRGEDRAKE
jgi:hypothetical protein